MNLCTLKKKKKKRRAVAHLMGTLFFSNIIQVVSKDITKLCQLNYAIYTIGSKTMMLSQFKCDTIVLFFASN